MWVLKFIIPYMQSQLLGNLTKEHSITAMGYPLSHEIKNNKLFVLISGYLIGDSKNKKNLLRDLKKDTRLIRMEMMDDSFGFWLMEQYMGNKVFFDPEVISIKPNIIDKEGNYHFELASWNRKKLENIIKVIETRVYAGKLLSFRQEKVKTITITSFIPNLTGRQKRAIELAVEHGYYGYPRKVEIGQLAKMMKLSYSTYQFHLRNAEKKLMPHLAFSI